MTAGFSGEVSHYYARYRRGYPTTVLAALSEALSLSRADTVIDLGCGTGQLTLPLARNVDLVVGVDPEPDMLHHAKQAARAAGVTNVQWIRGTAEDLAQIAAKLGGLGAITMANTIHLVDRDKLFASAARVLRPGRGLCIIANGTPLWQQDSNWSHALCTFLERWLETTLASRCGTDDEARATYRCELAALGYEVDEIRVRYTDTLALDQITGGVFSAMSSRLPGAKDRPRFATELSEALADTGPFLEDVQVRMLIARVP